MDRDGISTETIHLSTRKENQNKKILIECQNSMFTISSIKFADNAIIFVAKKRGEK